MDSSSDLKPTRSKNIEGSGVKRYSWWWLVSALAIGLFLGLGLLAIINMIARPLAIVILAIAIATALSPLVGRLERWMPRVLAAILVYLVLFLILVGIGFIVFPTLVEQGRAFIVAAPQYLDTIEEWIDNNTFLDIDEMVGTLFDQLGTIATALLVLPLNIASAFIEIFLILFIALYWIILIPKMKGFFLSLFAIEERNRIDYVLMRMGESMGGYIRGTAIDGFIVAIITYVGLSIIGVQYSLVLGIIAGFMEIIPILGPIIGGTLIVATALAQDPQLAIIALIFVLILQQVESNILVPNIMRSQTETSPLLVLIAILIGSTLGGLIGALVAIPLASAARVLVKFVIAPAVRRNNHAPQEDIIDELTKGEEVLVKEYETDDVEEPDSKSEEES
jgi:predicted PurR-regulated permease PerM